MCLEKHPTCFNSPHSSANPMVIANCCRILRPSFSHRGEILRSKSTGIFPGTESSPPPSSPLRCLFFFLFFSRLRDALNCSLLSLSVIVFQHCYSRLTSQSPPPVLLLHLPALLILNPGWLAGKAPPSKSLAAHFLAPQELSCMWNALKLKLHAIYITWLLQGTSCLA